MTERTFCVQSFLGFIESFSALTLWLNAQSSRILCLYVYSFIISKITLVISSTYLLLWLQIADFQAGVLRHPLYPSWVPGGRLSGPAHNTVLMLCVLRGFLKLTLGNWPVICQGQFLNSEKHVGPCTKQDTGTWQMKDHPPSTLVQFQTLHLLDTEAG